MLGFIRPEYDYDGLDALVKDIKMDCEVAERSLSREKYKVFEGEQCLTDFKWVESTDAERVEREVLKKDGRD